MQCFYIELIISMYYLNIKTSCIIFVDNGVENVYHAGSGFVSFWSGGSRGSCSVFKLFGNAEEKRYVVYIKEINI